ncbi:glycosyltransferase [Candidatus Peribacteria bacterium]|nr:glycosyltransferase [Candidatus Peribacteria bacterium]
MRLLIVTQKVDKADPILGFFHRWIEEFAKNCEHVIVVGQMVGEHALPSNVTVLSLGKERGSWRGVQILRYQWLLFTRRKEYDAIFVHMTPIWAVAAWLCTSRFAILFFRKPVYLWYEARGKRWPLRVALLLVRKAFSASRAGMPIVTKKSVITGHGIDTEFFRPAAMGHKKEMLLTISRITASKRLPILLHMLTQLPPPYRLTVMGLPLTPADEKEFASLKESVTTLGLQGRIEFNWHPQEKIPALLQLAGLFVHASATSLDKALLEAMACECLVLSCADAARGVLPDQCLAKPDTMAHWVEALLSLPEQQQDALRKQLREIVVKDHSLERLVKRLVQEMT